MSIYRSWKTERETYSSQLQIEAVLSYKQTNNKEDHVRRASVAFSKLRYYVLYRFGLNYNECPDIIIEL
jgi:hypothetical protein